MMAGSSARRLEQSLRVVGRRKAAAMRTVVRALHMLTPSHADTLPDKKPQYLLVPSYHSSPRNDNRCARSSSSRTANAAHQLYIHFISTTQVFMRCTFAGAAGRLRMAHTSATLRPTRTRDLAHQTPPPQPRRACPPRPHSTPRSRLRTCGCAAEPDSGTETEQSQEPHYATHPAVRGHELHAAAAEVSLGGWICARRLRRSAGQPTGADVGRSRGEG
jgi:hypothetical protein